MARYHSIYQSQKSPARWPWVLAVLLVALMAGGFGALLGTGRLSSVFPQSTSAPPTSQAVAAVSSTSTATAESTAEPDASASAAASTATPAPTPSPTRVVDQESASDVIRAWGERWSIGDYAGMYALMTTASQGTISMGDFVARYQAIAAEAGLTAISMEMTSPPDLNTVAVVRVVYTSKYLGQIEQENTIQMRQESKRWRVDWTPSLIFRDLADRCVDYTAEPVTRGAILDRNGTPLAYEGFINVLGIIPGQFKSEEAEVRALSKLIGMSTTEIKAKYKDGQDGWFMPVKRYPQEMDSKIINGVIDLPGVAIRTERARIYPLGEKAAHLTGFATLVTAEDLAKDTEGALTAGDWLGRTGLEAGANDLLAGRSGGRLTIVDCTTRVETNLVAKRDAIQSQDLILSVDASFQTATFDALGDVKGSVVVLDPRNGAVLAMVSRPSYDPNWFVTGATDKEWASLNDESKRPLFNRAAESGYPTGSIFKVITMAAGMKHLGYTGDSVIDCPQTWSIPGTDQIWRDWTAEYEQGAQGPMPLHWGLVNSCNTIFYELGYELDTKDDTLLPEMAKSFGLGTATGIPYLPEISGTVPDPAWKLEAIGDYWATGDAVNLSIGQGFLSATPLQMAVAYAAIANGGSVLQPFVVEYLQSADGSLTRVGTRTERWALPLKKRQIAEIQSALRDQTSNEYGAGSSKVFGDYTWPIAGKTGTAQNQMTAEQKPHSWFAAFGPYGEEATITTIAMVESVGEGVSFAAPVTRSVYDAYLATDLAERTNVEDPPPYKRPDEYGQ